MFVNYNLISLAVVVFCLTISAICKPMTDEENETLELVHVLFRHGDRTNDRFVIYPKDPHINETYEPYGLGELTKKGKKKLYRVGKALRERYDKFLGKSYHPRLLEAVSSDSNRTKVSLLLVLASLFPPTPDEIWEEGLNWQPIPVRHYPKNRDNIFFGLFCPNYKKLYREYIESPKIAEQNLQHKELFEYLSEHTGWNVTSSKEVFFLYLDLKVEEEFNMELPEWTKKVYPKQIEDIAVQFYFESTGTTALRQMAAGYLLQKIINDSNAKIADKLKPSGRKLFLYSGHEINIAYLLATLGLLKPHVPPYGSYILIELHKINGVHGFKIFYQDYTTREPQIMKLAACDEFCPFDQFLSLVQEYLPTPGLCGYECN